VNVPPLGNSVGPGGSSLRDLGSFLHVHPALKRWAKLGCASGTMPKTCMARRGCTACNEAASARRILLQNCIVVPEVLLQNCIVVPEARSNLAQRFSAGWQAVSSRSPGGTTRLIPIHISDRNPHCIFSKTQGTLLRNSSWHDARLDFRCTRRRLAFARHSR